MERKAEDLALERIKEVTEVKDFKTLDLILILLAAMSTILIYIAVVLKRIADIFSRAPEVVAEKAAMPTHAASTAETLGTLEAQEIAFDNCGHYGSVAGSKD